MCSLHLHVFTSKYCITRLAPPQLGIGLGKRGFAIGGESQCDAGSKHLYIYGIKFCSQYKYRGEVVHIIKPIYILIERIIETCLDLVIGAGCS